MYPSSFSTPTKSTPRSAAATPVVPLPRNGSITNRAPVVSRTRRASETGKGAGCGFLQSGSKLHTSPTCEAAWSRSRQPGFA